MAGILGGMPGIGGQAPQIDPRMLQQAFMQMRAQNANPMARPIAGSEYLQGLGQGGGGQMPQQMPQGMPGQMPQMGQQMPQQQGLPELPEDMSGFGMGAMKPQAYTPEPSLRRKLIEELLGQLMP